MGGVTSPGISAVHRIAIIGTGPLSLLKAYFLSKKNPNAEITLIDSASQTGGAWYSDYSTKGHLIECGCHIWSYAPKAYEFIEKELGVKLVPMNPAPIFVGKTISLPYSLKNTIDSYRALFNHLIRFKFSELRTNYHRPYIHYRIFGKNNQYPQKGSPELIQAIEKKIRSNNQIKILLNTKISALEIGAQVKLISGEKTYEFDKVFLTYVSHIQKATLPDETITGTPRQVDYVHFLVASNKPLRRKLTYWRLMNDPIVHRITDISYQTGFAEHLFLVGIKGDAFHSKPEDVLFGQVKNLMKSLKLIDEKQTFDLIKTHVFPTYYMDQKLHGGLSKYPEKIGALPTTDLMYGLHYLLCDEMPHLIKTPK